MMEDNDMFLVIVGDASEEVKIPAPIQIKQECFEEDENMRVEDIIEQAEKHGEYIKVEIDLENEYECLDGDETQVEEYLDSIKQEKEEEEEEGEDDCELDYTDYMETDDIPEIDKKKKELSKPDPHSTILKPCEDNSFVEDLRDQYPELRVNTKLLVSTLCEIMRNVKRPPLPEGHYVKTDSGFLCPKCGHESQTIPAAARHYREKHGPRYLMCYACGVDFRSTTNLYKHEKRCLAPDKRIVLMARAACLGNKGRGRPFLKSGYKVPPRVRHSGKFACTECSAEFNTKSNLMSHSYLHRGVRPFQCDSCPAAYTSYTALMRHTKKHTDVQFICDHCQRSFKVKAALVSHMDTHRAVRKFGCELCDRRYAQKHALQLHVDRVHYNLPPPHACQICPKRYPRMSLLKTHMKNEHGLAIMTQKMFFKKLPMLSDAQMKQAAKTVFKTDTPAQKYFNQLDSNMAFIDNINDEQDDDEDDHILPD